jgi:hypothetical protein
MAGIDGPLEERGRTGEITSIPTHIPEPARGPRCVLGVAGFERALVCGYRPGRVPLLFSLLALGERGLRRRASIAPGSWPRLT